MKEKAEALRTYAKIFMMPRRYEAGGRLYPPTEPCAAAAEALLMMAEILEKQGPPHGDKAAPEVIGGNLSDGF